MKTIQLLALLGILGAAACSDSAAVVPDAGSPDAGVPPCIMNPTTSADIPNGCTTAIGINKQTVLPLLNSDGSLPPLP